MIRRLRFLCVIPVLSGALAVHGCGTDEFVDVCNPDNLYFSSIRCGPDAGKDAGADADADTADAPGPMSNQDCNGTCVPFAEGQGAAFWTRWPDLLLLQAPGPVPPSCPTGFAEQLLYYADLNAPPPVCGVCKCEESTGQCTGMPSEIYIAAGQCGDPGATKLPFDGPPDWDGSCTSANALAAGVKCPAGSNTPCAQSVSFGPLPGPTSESCAVAVEPIPALQFSRSWDTVGILCRGDVDETRCGQGAVCASELGPPWRQCVWRSGKHEQCPTHYEDGPYFLYPEDAVIDTRNCSACECGPPVGSECIGTYHVFEDGACTSQFAEEMISSTIGQCTNLISPGKAVGGKAITDLAYLPGTCEASGGEPVGEAHGDETQAVTFCCYSP